MLGQFTKHCNYQERKKTLKSMGGHPFLDIVADFRSTVSRRPQPIPLFHLNSTVKSILFQDYRIPNDRTTSLMLVAAFCHPDRTPNRLLANSWYPKHLPITVTSCHRNTFAVQVKLAFSTNEPTGQNALPNNDLILLKPET